MTEQTQPRTTVPGHLWTNREWSGLLLLFTENDKLNRCFTTEYFDFEDGHIEIDDLKKLSRKWSETEKLMLQVALHCYDPKNKVDLSLMTSLDPQNVALVLKALNLRYGPPAHTLDAEVKLYPERVIVTTSHDAKVFDLSATTRGHLASLSRKLTYVASRLEELESEEE